MKMFVACLFALCCLLAEGLQAQETICVNGRCYQVMPVRQAARTVASVPIQVVRSVASDFCFVPNSVNYAAASGVCNCGCPNCPCDDAVQAAKVASQSVYLQTEYSSPIGYHRHLMVDGSILEHSNANRGNAAAHVGVASNRLSRWPRYYGSLPPTTFEQYGDGLYETTASFRARQGLFARIFNRRALRSTGRMQSLENYAATGTDSPFLRLVAAAAPNAIVSFGY